MTSKVITTASDFEKAFQIREQIFVKEQGVPLEDEFDQYDQLQSNCIHILIYQHDIPVGTGRIRKTESYAKLERICVLPDYRAFGIGKEIVLTLEQIAIDHGWNTLLLHGQTHAKHFYEKLGFESISEEFLEDNIPHLKMKKDLS